MEAEFNSWESADGKTEFKLDLTDNIKQLDAQPYLWPPTSADKKSILIAIICRFVFDHLLAAFNAFGFA